MLTHVEPSVRSRSPTAFEKNSSSFSVLEPLRPRRQSGRAERNAPRPFSPQCRLSTYSYNFHKALALLFRTVPQASLQHSRRDGWDLPVSGATALPPLAAPPCPPGDGGCCAPVAFPLAIPGQLSAKVALSFPLPISPLPLSLSPLSLPRRVPLAGALCAGCAARSACALRR